MMMRGSRGTNESGKPAVYSDEPEARISQLRFSSSVMRNSVIEDPFPWKPEHENWVTYKYGKFLVNEVQ